MKNTNDPFNKFYLIKEIMSHQIFLYYFYFIQSITLLVKIYISKLTINSNIHPPAYFQQLYQK